MGDLFEIGRDPYVLKENLSADSFGDYVLAMRTFTNDGYVDFSKPYWITNDSGTDEPIYLEYGQFAIVVADMDSTLPKIGKVVLNANKRRLRLGRHVRKIKVNPNYNPFFVYGVLRLDEMNQKLKLEANGSIAKVLSDKDVYKQKSEIPVTIKEQNEIGQLLVTVEKRIASNQQKLDQLKEMKKWFMQNMFV